MVDEVGQYIGNSSELILNLQSIVQCLGTECNGHAWVVVTSQQAIDSVAKNLKANDFSKLYVEMLTLILDLSAILSSIISNSFLHIILNPNTEIHLSPTPLKLKLYGSENA